ncbi:hypothetical protein M878_10390 [Streptomyces roseochromogenus subsp. oscitans DS 12.976]|uniref:HTH cro/C1-type domain-containing protein n=1 Tax=Streptomyces roseochromogenus subsp. oscitans DS 12.976 TaxID=1352936 RepID=V6KQD6_STRRC|nr:hypothetical protein M878_10390 [Streptomyces roseochromogenus subsp. oscitans DS 12.976]
MVIALNVNDDICVRCAEVHVMGRPERPVDPQAGPVQRLAYELRELRKAAGSPSYRTMAKAAGFSATALSSGRSGRSAHSLARCGLPPLRMNRRRLEGV